MPKLLKDCTDDNTDEFSLAGETYEAKCVDVYDGDTITVVMKPKIDTKYSKFKIRLLGIDTPEIRTRDIEEKQLGYIARDFLQQKILNKIVTIKCGEFGNFGRLLGVVLLDDENINELMLADGYAVPYKR
jgi:micrococcal nuclease